MLDTSKGSIYYWNYLEDHWPCADGLSAVNAIVTQLRDLINSGLTRWRLTIYMNAVAESAKNLVAKEIMIRLTRDGTAEPVSRDKILRHARGQGNIIFPVQLTTRRIGNLTRLIHTLLRYNARDDYCSVCISALEGATVVLRQYTINTYRHINSNICRIQ